MSDLLNRDYQNYSLSGLATYYNELAEHLSVKQIKKFADRKSAVRRIKGLIATAAPTAVEETVEPVKEEVVNETPKPKKVKKDSEPKTARFNFNLEGRPSQRKLREGTKRYHLFVLLSGTAGATFDECMICTGWNRKDCYEGIRLLNTYCGFGLEHDLETGVIKIK